MGIVCWQSNLWMGSLLLGTKYLRIILMLPITYISILIPFRLRILDGLTISRLITSHSSLWRTPFPSKKSRNQISLVQMILLRSEKLFLSLFVWRLEKLYPISINIQLYSSSISLTIFLDSLKLHYCTCYNRYFFTMPFPIS